MSGKMNTLIDSLVGVKGQEIFEAQVTIATA